MKTLNAAVASVVDSRQIAVDTQTADMRSVPRLISRIENLSVAIQPPAKVIINERTGTIVLGGDVLLSPVSVLHGGLQIQVDTVVNATEAAPGSNAAPAVVTNTSVRVQDKEASSIRLENGADVEELVRGLHTIGATAHDIVSILKQSRPQADCRQTEVI